jgi:hypothetical protein
MCDHHWQTDISSLWSSYHTQCKLVREISHAHVWHILYCPRANSFYAMRKTTVYASSFFIERITTSIVYIDMLQHLLSPPINKDETEEQTLLNKMTDLVFILKCLNLYTFLYHVRVHGALVGWSTTFQDRLRAWFLGVNSVSNRNEYQGCLLVGIKAAGS